MENSYLTECDGKQMSFLIHFPIIPRNATHCHSVTYHISIWSSLSLPVEGHHYYFPENSTTGVAEGKVFLLKCSVETKVLLNTPQKNVTVLYGDTMHKSGWNTAGRWMNTMWNLLNSVTMDRILWCSHLTQYSDTKTRKEVHFTNLWICHFYPLKCAILCVLKVGLFFLMSWIQKSIW